ncbi:MAG: Uma2 family endonuclease [Microcystis sp. M53603_WE2]|jgi:Uma2 family endonuclease|uniref:Putative restriction endonuclease domain-containing protein n=1 Tax=Microcystis aeruginosa PCC 9717 TaxID=1160286 RepID=I4FLG2_MICAE|nr:MULTISPECIES: Uma2 family endonuclease [Microcystis]MCE2661499.1 Uma2 family endonuclease [Microcystis sp. 53602_E8]MDJ0529587.1 Uma2 family endonuclease [Microcystis sp. M53600_WE12]MDJ0539950.1 Uma2 family endonuclease [Microcystis sp. M53603_WE2]MDJ0587108.1 Uma2 family endonuclease [Microcystis sp. M49636_WE2]MDJ0606995.1 Uma2 family endonuclease [Microcystis sp. M53602_WE12]
MTIATDKSTYSFAEYLQLEETAAYKNEYQDGEIVPMTGGTTDHNKIALNFAAYLKFALKEQKYNIFIGDVKLWIAQYRQATYPDVMLIEGEPIYYETGKTTVTNPRLIVEVLSKSTQNYDQGDKFLYYRSLPELQEYILISQSRPYIMQYNKTEENKWLLTEYEGENASLSLTSVNFALSFQEIYEGVTFNISSWL